MRELNALWTIAYRDQLKFLRDPMRIVSSLVFPVVFISFFGVGMRANLPIPYDYLVFTFTGVLAMNVFQSAAMGLVSLIEDRENDFSQEIFVSPVSRYTIALGKIWGETLVAMSQGLAILAIGPLLGVPLPIAALLGVLLVSLLVCLMGGAFGLLVMSLLSSQRAAQQVFPFLMLPQYFLAGVFTPIQNLPLALDVLSRLSPMRYAVDLVRSVYYLWHPDYPRVVLEPVGINLIATSILLVVFIVLGTSLFAGRERNR